AWRESATSHQFPGCHGRTGGACRLGEPTQSLAGSWRAAAGAAASHGKAYAPRFGPFGSSGSALHAKTFAVDGKRLFVGSFNFDPRSVNLNTELGFIIESPEMAQALSKSFDEVLPYRSYRVDLDENGDLVWIQLNEDGTERFFTSEPNAIIWRRAGVGVLSILPIEWLL